MSLKTMSISRWPSRAAALSFFIITLFSITHFLPNSRSQLVSHGISEEPSSQIPLDSTLFKGPDTERLDFSELECKVAFPGTTQSIDDSLARGKFVFKKSDGDYQGLVQAQIKDGKVRHTWSLLCVREPLSC